MYVAISAQQYRLYALLCIIFINACGPVQEMTEYIVILGYIDANHLIIHFVVL